MKDGEKAILVPGSSTMKLTGSSAHRSRVESTLKAMTEEVTILKLHNGTGNSKVRDNRGVQFNCNTNDLMTTYDDYFSFK
ncbi:hypothetical protein SAMN06265348_1306 [Pedobacter westerhofensis]|uniref:Uncharacterized protein n=1 Tax=Pedobacter westerhofensis TaxID=425512 RepID=A0A521FUS4_9SPHI|nr:hypothetical protein [Pedobacter westerhofensis]SMO99939.1 hypothetical protein SAMN06265348_1306 [Pedobacter westerhofensis]